MENLNPEFRRHGNARKSWGLVMIVLGIILVLNIMDVFPYDVKRIIFSWEMLLILFGLLSLVNNQSKVMGIVLISLGVFFLGIHFFDLPYYFKRAFWPVVLIAFGAYLVFSPTRHFRHWRKRDEEKDSRDFIDEVAVFGGGDRVVTSQNFQGGRIVGIFGGLKVNLMSAKLAEGQHILDTLSVFGGATVIVPASWSVKVEVTSIFGGFSDKRERMPNLVIDQGKTLHIKGLAIFGGGEVKSFGI